MKQTYIFILLLSLLVFIPSQVVRAEENEDTLEMETQTENKTHEEARKELNKENRKKQLEGQREQKSKPMEERKQNVEKLKENKEVQMQKMKEDRELIKAKRSEQLCDVRMRLITHRLTKLQKVKEDYATRYTTFLEKLETLKDKVGANQCNTTAIDAGISKMEGHIDTFNGSVDEAIAELEAMKGEQCVESDTTETDNSQNSSEISGFFKDLKSKAEVVRDTYFRDIRQDVKKAIQQCKQQVAGTDKSEDED